MDAHVLECDVGILRAQSQASLSEWMFIVGKGKDLLAVQLDVEGGFLEVNMQGVPLGRRLKFG